jgi:hypothetical protein
VTPLDWVFQHWSPRNVTSRHNDCLTKRAVGERAVGKQARKYALILQADRGFATSRYRSDEDGTILAHNILHGFDWNIEKGGNAPRAPDEMRDFYPPQAS